MNESCIVKICRVPLLRGKFYGIMMDLRVVLCDLVRLFMVKRLSVSICFGIYRAGIRLWTIEIVPFGKSYSENTLFSVWIEIK